MQYMASIRMKTKQLCPGGQETNVLFGNFTEFQSVFTGAQLRTGQARSVILALKSKLYCQSTQSFYIDKLFAQLCQHLNAGIRFLNLKNFLIVLILYFLTSTTALLLYTAYCVADVEARNRISRELKLVPRLRNIKRKMLNHFRCKKKCLTYFLQNRITYVCLLNLLML